MKTLRHVQTKEKLPLEALFRLPVSAGVISPYFTGRDTKLITKYMAVDRAIVDSLGPVGGGQLYASAHFMDGTTEADTYNIFFDVSSAMSEQNVFDAAKAAVTAYATGHSYTLTNGIIMPFLSHDEVTSLITAMLPSAPASYQTIVSQTGTSAPAVSGGLTPANTYSGTPTFTWARTGAGVYTLTASSAVFTSGKTGVFITPPQNLNGSFRAVVTSTTVITVTTAVQSLAVLGLLGFTATPTDALLSNTMIYVQTYS